MVAVVAPFVLLTRTLAGPAVPAGVVAVKLVALTGVRPVAAAPPMVTSLGPIPMKLSPVIVTMVPPKVEPVAGEMDVIFGGRVFSTLISNAKTRKC